MTNLESLAAAAAAAIAAEKAAAAASKAARADLLAALQDADLKSVKTAVGTVSVVSGRRTVKVTCPALQAEIKLMQERAVRTGRATESIGAPYVSIR
jgi:hypothetical protein